MRMVFLRQTLKSCWRWIKRVISAQPVEKHCLLRIQRISPSALTHDVQGLTGE